jgi:hypothetical protein
MTTDADYLRMFARQLRDATDARDLPCKPADRIERIAADLDGARVVRIPEGWKLVPLEPTMRMVGVGIEAYNGKCETAYRAMVLAAPEPPVGELNVAEQTDLDYAMARLFEITPPAPGEGAKSVREIADRAVWAYRLMENERDGALRQRADWKAAYEGEVERPQCYYAEWMPYQKGQAAKTEALEKQVAGA